MKRGKNFILFSVLLVLLAGCVKNDLPYPTIVGEINEFALQGQTQMKIDKATATVSVKVTDSLDLTRLKVEKLVVTDGMTVIPDEEACLDFAHFPDTGFVHVDSLPPTADTRMNFKKPVSFTLSLYQDYLWTVTVERDIQQRVNVKNQQGSALIDKNTHNVIIYVDSLSQPSLRNIEIEALSLGGSTATVVPDPKSVTDFTRPRTFLFTAFGETEEWTVSVAYPPAGMSFTTVSAFAKRACVSGVTRTGMVSARYRVKPETETKAETDGEWQNVLASEIKIDEEGNFVLTFTHLQPGKVYEYELTVDGVTEDIKTFETEPVQLIPNLSLDDWYKDGKSWYANLDLELDHYFWDSGNKGSNAVGEANPTSPETSDVVRGKAARLESKTVAGVFAAGSLYTGTFGKVEGLSGASLNFGRPYTGRPSALKGFYKYNSGVIDKTKVPYQDLAGRRDSCHIYMALFSGWTAPFPVNTNTGMFVDLTWNNENLVAFGQFIQGETVKDYTQFRIDLEYRDLTTKPTYILIVASASKYGDFFTGSTSSVLLLDELELVFE